MTTPRELMQQLADLDLEPDVEARTTAATAWRTAAVRRQRRRVTATVVAVVAVAVAVPLIRAVGRPAAPPAGRPTAVTSLTPTPISTPTPAPDSGAVLPTVTLPDGVVVQQAPLPTLTRSWPVLAGPWAALTGLPTATDRVMALPTLTGDPVTTIRAAVDLQLDESVPVLVLVLGDDGGWRRVDTPLTTTLDGPGGNQGDPLDGGSISADGSQIAFPQPDAVIIVGRDGTSRRLAVPGWNEAVRWLPDGRHLLTGDLGTPATELDTVTGATTRGERPVSEVAIGSVAGSVLTSVSVIEPGNWYGAGHLAAGRLARSGFLSQELSADQGTAVVDQRTGAATVLRFGYLSTADPLQQRGKGCCETLGWLDQHRVILRDGQSVLAWDVDRARGYLVAALPVPAWTIALGPSAA